MTWRALVLRSSSDLDLFVYGVDVAAANAKLRAIYDVRRRHSPRSLFVAHCRSAAQCVRSNVAQAQVR